VKVLSLLFRFATWKVESKRQPLAHTQFMFYTTHIIHVIPPTHTHTHTHLLQVAVQSVLVRLREAVLLHPQDELRLPVGLEGQQVCEPLSERSLLRTALLHRVAGDDDGPRRPARRGHIRQARRRLPDLNLLTWGTSEERERERERGSSYQSDFICIALFIQTPCPSHPHTEQ